MWGTDINEGGGGGEGSRDEMNGMYSVDRVASIRSRSSTGNGGNTNREGKL